MSKCQVLVRQIPGYYVLNLHFSFNIDGNRWVTFPQSVEYSLHFISRAVNEIATDIAENFSVSTMLVHEEIPSIHIKCERTELRKIETWLSLGNYELVPLRKWKNEKTLNKDT